VWTCQGACIVQKGAQLCKTIPVCDVVDQDCASSTAIVTPAHTSEAFCTGGVPELQLYSLSAVAVTDFYDFGSEFDADGLGGENAPGRVDEAVQKTGLSG
jgi:hypothetical protein